ncbi:MAG: electron transfer flavoprotein subunit beta/FixA family protein [Eubacterium sp.]
MKIVVCVKQVPDDSVEIRLNAEGKPNIEKVAQVVNAFDTYSLEMAARLKEATDGEITVICIGDDSAKNSLKNCLAVGADNAILISDAAFEGSDARGISHILKNAIAKIEADNGASFDLIFCGKEATDQALGQVGLQLAKALDFGVITNIIDITAEDGRVSAKQETEEGYRMIESAMPCVVTVTKPEYDPRYPTIKNKMAARKKAIGTLDATALTDLDAQKIGEKGTLVKTLSIFEPPKKEAGLKIQEESDEESAIKAVALMDEAKVF